LQTVDFTKTKKLTVKENILAMIEKYERIKNESQEEIEKQALQNTIDTLYKKLYHIDGPEKIKEPKEIEVISPRIRKEEVTVEKEWSESPNKKKIAAKEARRLKALKDIFDFYAKKGASSIYLYKNFEDIVRESQEISLENFSILLKDFRIKIDPAVKSLNFFY